MRQAGVNLATVGVFSWSSLEPEPGRYEFGWLDRVLDLLHDDGIRVEPGHADRVTTALVHPGSPRRAAGHRGRRTALHGSRDTYCACAPAYREAAVGIAKALAERYGDHPALAMWHVHNEYGIDLLLRPCRRGLPELAAAPVRRPRRAQRRLDHRPSGVSATRPGSRFPAAAGPSTCRIPRRRWISGASSPTSCSPPTASSGPYCGPHPRRTGHHELRLRRLGAGRPLALVSRGRPGCDRPLSRPSAGTGAEQQTAFGADLARSLGGGRPLAADGEGAHADQRPRSVARQGTRPDARNSLSHVARGSARRDVLPVAGLARWSRRFHCGDGPARRCRHQGLPRDHRTRQPAPEARRSGPGAGRGRGRDPLGRRVLVGAPTDPGCRRPRSTTWQRSRPPIGSSGISGSPPTSRIRRRT